MKRIFLMSLILLVFGYTKAQEKTNVGIIPFTNLGSGASNQDVIAIQEAVTSSFVKTKRFNIVDRTKISELQKEKNLQKSEDFIDGTVVQQGISLGAKFLISGKVTTATKFSGYKTRTKLDGTKVNELVNEASVNFSCQVIDVETGQVINSETFSNAGGGNFLGLSLAKNVDEAFTSCLTSLSSDIDKWVHVNFPSIFSIAEIQTKDGKGAATKILMAGGSAFGLEKGDRLKVVEVSEMEINGKKIKRKKEIGEIKIDKIEDENFSICSVKEGGIDINSKFEANANLQIITKN